MPASEFHTVYSDVRWADAFYRFLQNIYHLYPEDRFHTLIKECVAAHSDDESIYRLIQKRLPEINPFLGAFRYALPALAQQKAEMVHQTLQLLGSKQTFDGYVEIGTTGRYISRLRKVINLHGPLILINDVAPTNSPPDIMERGQLGKLGEFVPLNSYAPIATSHIADGSVDLVTCYIGLHHVAPDVLTPFIQSIYRILRPGGTFILRDHDVTTPEMNAFVSLAHTVFNAGLGVPWVTNQHELRFFVSVVEWMRRLQGAGFHPFGECLLQTHDPSDNTLMAFAKG